jgi:hypothetical protein
MVAILNGAMGVKRCRVPECKRSEVAVLVAERRG